MTIFFLYLKYDRTLHLALLCGIYLREIMEHAGILFMITVIKGKWLKYLTIRNNYLTYSHELKIVYRIFNDTGKYSWYN